MEIFAKPCVGAILERTIDREKHILVQTRQKRDGGETNGMLELPAGKMREYEEVFSALRREVWEETGLRVTKIQGEERALRDAATVSFAPYCVTQNLSGAYSILLHTFLCEAEGEPLSGTDETENIRWMPVREVRRLVEEEPEKIFFIHIPALKKYLGL